MDKLEWTEKSLPSEILRQIRDNEDVDLENFKALTDVIGKAEIMERGYAIVSERPKRRAPAKKVDPTESADASA